MPARINWHNNRLSRLLLTYIILCSSFFTLIGTGVQLYGDYQSDIKAIKNGIRYIEKGYLKTLAASLWAVNHSQMRNSLEGASYLPDIQYLEVREISDDSEKILSSWGVQQHEQVIKQVFPLYYGQSNRQIGSLLIVASTGKVIQRLKEKLLLILLTQGIKTFMMSLCILIIFHRLIMRHLIAISSYFANFDLENLDTSLSIRRRLSRLIKSDLFEVLVNSINTMRLRLKENLKIRSVNEGELRRLRNQLKNIIDSMPAMLILQDRNGKVSFWNKTAEEETGIKSDEAQGKPLVEVFPLLADEMDLFQKVLKDAHPEKKERKVRQLGNRTVYWNIMAYPLTTNGLEGVVIRIEDVTEKVRIDQMLIQNEKMISVGGIAAGIAHEINNPLTIIISGIQNVTRRIKPTLKKNLEAASLLELDLNTVHDYMEKRDIVKYLQGIEESGKRAAKIVANMLHFSRRSETEMSTVELSRLVEKSIDLASKDYNLGKKYDFKHIKINRHFQPEQISLVCSETEIEQVLLNLLKNAAEAIFECKNIKNPEINLSAHSDGEKIRIEIEDDGPGMNEEERKRVFEPFYTTKPVGQGTGLGLSVSYLIITKNHGGTMEVESAEGQGTKFIIHLPAKSG